MRIRAGGLWRRWLGPRSGRFAFALASWVLVMLALLPGSAVAQQAAATRLRVVLVLDASGSMVANDPGRIVANSAKIFTELTDERDRVTALSFGSSVTKLGEGRGDEHDALRAGIGALGRSESCTDYALALEAAARELSGKPGPGERRVVLFLTDGRYEPARSGGACGPFETGSGPEVDAAEQRVRAASKALATADARVFALVLGKSALGAQRSASLLADVARETKGRYVPIASTRDVPRIFASIFGSLVGAPVLEDSLGPGRSQISLVAPRGSERLHVVLVPEALDDVASVALRRAGKELPFEPPRAEGPRGGYRVARLTGDASGEFELSGPARGGVSVLFVPDAGVSLVLEGVPSVLPEGDQLSATVALRSRAGDELKLAPDFLQKVSFTAELDGKPQGELRAASDGVARVVVPAGLSRGRHSLRLRASHELGFLEVEPVEHVFSVEPRFAATLRGEPGRFDTMAEAGLIPQSETLAFVVDAPDPLPVELVYSLELPEGPEWRDLVIEPRELRFGPGLPKRIELSLSWADPVELWRVECRYRSELRLVPDAASAAMLLGESTVVAELDGKLRAWTWRRYLDEYGTRLALGLGALLSVVWLIGRAIAPKFPPKARVRYVEIGQAFESESLVKRHAKHGSFRAARLSFPLGKKARPQIVFRSTGAGFEVELPAGRTVELVDESIPAEERTRRKGFRGMWEQRYRVGDRYEVWLTRS